LKVEFGNVQALDDDVVQIGGQPLPFLEPDAQHAFVVYLFGPFSDPAFDVLVDNLQLSPRLLPPGVD
jgi:hypothetical protein